jgi:hypothetical protein
MQGKGRARSIASAQPKMKMLSLEVDGTLGTPAASGFDGKQVSVIDNGTGDYTIVLKRPGAKANANKCKAMVTPLEADTICHVDAVDHDRVTVKCFASDGITAKDAQISMLIMACDHRFNY